MNESRVEALRLAKDFLYKKIESKAEDVVDTAKKFLAFLDNE